MESSFSVSVVSTCHISLSPRQQQPITASPGQELTLIIQQLLPRLRRVLRIGTLHNRIHGTALLAETAVDALGHVDIVAGRPSASIGTLFGLDGDGLSRADGLAELAGDAAFFARGVTTKGVLAAEAGGDGTLFEGVVDCVPGMGVSVDTGRWVCAVVRKLLIVVMRSGGRSSTVRARLTKRRAAEPQSPYSPVRES